MPPLEPLYQTVQCGRHSTIILLFDCTLNKTKSSHKIHMYEYIFSKAIHHPWSLSKYCTSTRKRTLLIRCYHTAINSNTVHDLLL